MKKNKNLHKESRKEQERCAVSLAGAPFLKEAGEENRLRGIRSLTVVGQVEGHTVSAGRG